MQSGGDPLDWTVDEVVQFLCLNPQTPWTLSSSRAPRPDPVTFEAAIRDNLVTGEVLLHDVDKETLRDDLGLRALGHRSCILMAIRYLQRNSPKFQGSRTHLGAHLEDHSSPSWSSLATSSNYPRLSSPAYHAPLLQNATPQREVLHSPPPLTPTVSNPNPPAELPLNTGESEQTPFTTDGSRPAGTITNHNATHQDAGQGGPTPSPQRSSKGSDKRTRPGEDMVVDSHGHKRRRLNLGASTEKQSNDFSQKQAGRKEANEWYMGPDELSITQLFYSSDPDENDQAFTMIGSKFPDAQRSFVNKSLIHYYKQKPIKLNPNQSALVPYRQLTEQKSKPSKKPVVTNISGPRLCTLYTVEKGKVAVTKDELNKWPQLVNSGTTDGEKAADSFAYLLQKYPAEGNDQDAYPLYGDSGSEGEFDEETWQEMEDERREPLPQQKTLTSVEVDSIIESCILKFANNWHHNGKIREEPKTRKIWLAAKRSKSTNEQIKDIMRDIDRLGKRMAVFIKAIREGEYSTRKELQTQCQSLENTVANIQKQKWRIFVLEQETCPPKIPAPARPLPRKSKINNANEDGESLASDSDVSSTASLDSFVDDSDAVHVVDQSMRRASPAQTPSSSSDEDDIISPSGARRKSRARGLLPFIQSSSPSPAPMNDASVECIDLTADSPLPENSPPSDDDDYRVETPPLNPQPKTPQSEGLISRDISPGPDLGPRVCVEVPIKREDVTRSDKDGSRGLPEIHDVEKLKAFSWRLLEERHDRRRLLAKLIITLGEEERERLTRQVPRYDAADLAKLTQTALKRILKGKDSMPGMDEHESSVIMRTASLYISWVNCDHYKGRGFPKDSVVKATDEIAGFPGFFSELCLRLSAYGSWGKSMRTGEPEETQPALGDTPHKKRKREVKESQTAKMNQESAQLRVLHQEKLRERLERKLERMGVSNTDATHQAVSFGDPVIYLDPHIGQRIKPHQLSGVQFMWRELIEDDMRQGCLLAHTMGLGKTMQVISLLVTIANTAASENPAIRRTVPKSLHRSQTLILCPSSLIENWYEEFFMWTPKDSAIGPVNKVTSSDIVPERLDTVSRWNDEGGVLLVSYDMFRTWIFNKATNKRPKPLTDIEHENMKKWLLEGANIVIADEAHKMKNPTSAITAAAMQFRSQSRIALTGSPLANNLIDYFTMVNWIAGGYMGGFVEFKANFVEPIEEGLYLDSTYSERRRSLVKLQVLKTILDPKINRADISVLAGSLPPKVEFVITVPLTGVQKQAYDLYVQSVLQGRTDVSKVQIMSWIAILGLCCNHPVCFWNKLSSKANDAHKLDKMVDGLEPNPLDKPITQLGLDIDNLLPEQMRLFDTVPDANAPDLSCRANILDRIIAESIRAGDKVLVFSHSLPTLDYIEHLLKKSEYKYCRLDGQTPIAGRQATTKRFNRGSAENVYLISTRAGGLGLNIFGANRVIIFDFTFSPVWEEQAVGRAYRLGQQKPVFVYRFIAGGTFEEIMYNKTVFKTQLAFRVVDKKNPVRSATKKLGEYLFPAKQVPQKDVTEFLGKDPEVLDKIIREDACSSEKLIRKIALTETFQKDDNDKLTEEERKAAQEQLSDERLKRSDPDAYHKLVIERQRAQLSQSYPNISSTQYTSSIPSYPAQYHMQPAQYQYPMQPQSTHTNPPPHPQYLASPPIIPSNVHNFGPPALAPDMSVIQSSTPVSDTMQTPILIPGLSTALHVPVARSEPVSANEHNEYHPPTHNMSTDAPEQPSDPAVSAPAEGNVTGEKPQETNTPGSQSEPISGKLLALKEWLG
ncbi:SNF2 family helicase/ATPase [Aspergillus ellipticus CBS 707.79]|uniref:SNF2 family helicase/ATPase n=1 Tax=Aspergillus ellipticus CBS 707.79 TaxID=1448320 RepID=A0A319F2I2_9EURO|nr:SNF2 family helicase/ATPase [Aspergillus ellipticus CBS 707.79]